jgi:hypothetical protein
VEVALEAAEAQQPGEVALPPPEELEKSAEAAEAVMLAS